jgi:hypothetical protein
MPSGDDEQDRTHGPASPEPDPANDDAREMPKTLA